MPQMLVESACAASQHLNIQKVICYKTMIFLGAGLLLYPILIFSAGLLRRGIPNIFGTPLPSPRLAVAAKGSKRLSPAAGDIFI